MIYFGRCSKCNQPFDPLAARAKLGQYSNSGPWPVSFNVESVVCLACGKKTVGYQTSLSGSQVSSWMATEEVIWPQPSVTQTSTYRRVSTNAPLREKRLLDVVWAWHPLAGDVATDALIGSSLTNNADGVLDSEAASLLILPNGASETWIQQNPFRFSEVWELSASITSDAVGPYESIKAQRALINSLQSYQVRHISHFWPSSIFHAADYRKLAGDADLKTMWNTYSAAHVPVVAPAVITTKAK
jgi:hypothetical protein